jgi:hypothetical protein
MDARRIPFTAEDERCIVSAGTWGMIISIASIAMAAVSLVVHGELPRLHVEHVGTSASTSSRRSRPERATVIWNGVSSVPNQILIINAPS